MYVVIVLDPHGNYRVDSGHPTKRQASDRARSCHQQARTAAVVRISNSVELVRLHAFAIR